MILKKRSTGIMWLALAVSLCAAHGQHSVSLKLDHQQLVLFEPMMVQLKVVNESGSPLRLGSEDVGVSVHIAATDDSYFEGRSMVREGEVVPVAPWNSESLNVNLLDYFDVRKSGQYNVVARLTIGDRTIYSAKSFIEIVNGMLISSFEGQGRGLDSPVEYQLISIFRDRREIAFLRIMDKANRTCYGVYNLGSIVRLHQPSIMLSSEGVLHILHQSGPSRYTYSVLPASGASVQSKFYSSYGPAVTLQRGDGGNVSVRGGGEYTGDAYRVPVDNQLR